MSGGFQLWASGFATFYAIDAAISLYMAPRDHRRPFASRLFVGAVLAVAFLAVGLNQ